MRLIPLTKGLYAKVDDWNYDDLNQYYWVAKQDGKTYYAYRREKGHHITMHRQIMKTPKGLQVDHKDWDGLNNQESNLRNCTANDNCRWVRPRSNTGFLGASCHHTRSTNGNINIHYSASIKCNGIVYNLGSHKTAEAAAKAYDAKAKELFGEFANLNFK